MLHLEIEIEIFKFIQSDSTHLQVFGKLFNFLPLEAQIVNQSLDKLLLLMKLLLFLGHFELQAVNNGLIVSVIIEQAIEITLLFPQIDPP